MKPTALCLPLALALAACKPQVPEGPAPDALDLLLQPAFEATVERNIEELKASQAMAEAELPSGREPGSGELPALVEMFQTQRGRMREVPLTEVRTIGEGALPELLAMNADETLAGDRRNAALHLAFAVGTPAAIERVVEVLEEAREPWRRRYAAWLLGQTDDDRFLLRMLLVLRYEKDGETVVWLAEALARHGNYSGLAGLDTVISGGGPAAELARTKQGELVAEAALGLADVEALAELWSSPESHDRLDHEPSDALRLAAWVELGELSQERFQLRGVDDARFVLCRTGPWGARLVAEGLVDEDSYIRVHAAQVLERMGARARPVAAGLHPLLTDPLTAHAAAEALGSLRNPDSLPLLRAALAAHHPHELRVAAAHGLGKFGSGEAAVDLLAVVDAEESPADLRLAAAGALLRCGDGQDAALVLARGMTDSTGDPQGCEVYLGSWIEQGVESGTEGFAALQEAWAALEGPPPLLRTAEDTASRLEQRARLLQDFLSPGSED